jgi:hypothetical protein
MVKCPFCRSEGGFDELKSWRFRFYDVKRLLYLKCNSIFNHYLGISPKTNKRSEFVIRVREGKSR